MQNFTVPKLLACAIIIASALFLSSCINDVDNSQPTQFQIGLEIQNIDSSLIVGQDTLSLENVRLTFGRFNIATDTEILDLKDATAIVLPFQPQSPNYQNPDLIAGGNFPSNNYQSINIAFPKAPEGGSGSFDPDFYGDDGKRYTIVAEGMLNSTEFTYRSERPVDNSFALNLPTIPEEDAFFAFLIQTDVRDWFTGGQGLLDPTDPENTRQINDNIGQSFRFEQESNLGNQ